MRRIAISVYAGAVVIFAAFSARTSLRVLTELERRSPSATFEIIAGWSIATFAPLLLSVLILLFERRFKVRWPLHALFIPCAIALYGAGTNLIEPGGADGDDIVVGYALVGATVLLLMTMLFHACALLQILTRAKPPSAHDS